MAGIKYSKLHVKNPCFDEKAKKDCDRRKAGCKQCCPDWIAYEKSVSEERIQNEAKSAANADFMGYVSERARKMRGKYAK